MLPLKGFQPQGSACYKLKIHTKNTWYGKCLCDASFHMKVCYSTRKIQQFELGLDLAYLKGFPRYLGPWLMLLCKE